MLPEGEEEDGTGRLHRPGNERTVLILMGGQEDAGENGDEEGEEGDEGDEGEDGEMLMKEGAEVNKKKKKIRRKNSSSTGKKTKAEHSKKKGKRK